jgi:hypothetical protein
MAGTLARMRSAEIGKKFCSGNLKERNALKDLGVHKNIILKSFLKG